MAAWQHCRATTLAGWVALLQAERWGVVVRNTSEGGVGVPGTAWTGSDGGGRMGPCLLQIPHPLIQSNQTPLLTAESENFPIPWEVLTPVSNSSNSLGLPFRVCKWCAIHIQETRPVLPARFAFLGMVGCVEGTRRCQQQIDLSFQPLQICLASKVQVYVLA